MKLTLICLTVFVFSFASCNSAAINTLVPTDKFEMADDLIIKLEMGPCYGTCPVYTLTINADGSVLFDGEKHTVGKKEAKIAPEEVKKLLEEANAIDMLGLEDTYDTKTCPNYATDQSTAVVSVSSGGRSKSIVHYLGCAGENGGLGGYPPGLNEFEKRIIEVAGISKWYNF